MTTTNAAVGALILVPIFIAASAAIIALNSVVSTHLACFAPVPYLSKLLTYSGFLCGVQVLFPQIL